MQQPWVSIDLEADPHSAKVLTSTHAPTPWPEVGLLAAQSELRLQLFPALEARHTSESAALFEVTNRIESHWTGDMMRTVLKWRLVIIANVQPL